MADLARGRVLIKNWHEFEPGTPEGGGGARVVKAGRPETRTETDRHRAARSPPARGSRYFTPESYDAARANGDIEVVREETDDDGETCARRWCESTRYVESDAALVDRVLKEAGGQAEHPRHQRRGASRLSHPAEADDRTTTQRMTTTRMRRKRKPAARRRRSGSMGWTGSPSSAASTSASTCRATPYFLGRLGSATNTVFPWVVSDFGLTDAIESGLVKVPQLVARDGSGATDAGVFQHLGMDTAEADARPSAARSAAVRSRRRS